MNSREKINASSDTLIELLAAQCADLEQLLRLARAEASAAERRDFEAILEIVTERAALGERLEIFERRVAELRGFLGGAADQLWRGPAARQAAELAALTLAEDRRTALVLAAARDEAAGELRNLDRSQTMIGRYCGGGEPNKGLAYSRSF